MPLDEFVRAASRITAATSDAAKLAAFLEGKFDRATAQKVARLVALTELFAGSEPASSPKRFKAAIQAEVADIRRKAGATRRDDKPVVSIIIPVHNQIKFTLACVASLFAFPPRVPFEIIVGNDRSTDMTAEALRKLPATTVLEHDLGGFLLNVNACARRAKGDVLVILNNDTIVLPGAIDALCQTLGDDPGVGLVGSRLLYPDARLQEAGSFIFTNGAGFNWGRNDDPEKPEYTYLRDVDYCSAAAIAVPRPVWESLGGFDPIYVPAYYEDTDFAMRVRAGGQRVEYQPAAMVIHFEGASHGTDISQGTKRYQEINRETFVKRWADVLATEHASDVRGAINRHRGRAGRVLYVDHDVLKPDRDSGSMDAVNILRMLRQAGYDVTFLPTSLNYDRHYSPRLGALGISSIDRRYYPNLNEAIATFAARADIVILSRGPVAQRCLPVVRDSAPRAKIIFNTVDLHHVRAQRRAALLDDAALKKDAEEIRVAELKLVQQCDATIVVSENERNLLLSTLPGVNVHTLPLPRERPQVAAMSFDRRRNLIFVGGFGHPPNVDGLIWFLGEVWPRLKERGFDGRLDVVGADTPPEIKRRAGDGIAVHGHVTDLDPLFSATRLSIAPLRYGAGVKGKVVTSLSYGVPVVATSVAVEGTGLVDGLDVLVANDPEAFTEAILRAYSDQSLWQRLSANGVAAFDQRFSFDAVRSQLLSIVRAVRPPAHARFSSVVGLLALPRSGTTVLTSVIGAHPDVAAEFEPWNNAFNRTKHITSKGSGSLEEFCHTFPGRAERKTVLFVKETTTKPAYVDNVSRLLDSIAPPVRRDLIVLLRNPFHAFLSEVDAHRKWWGQPDLALDRATFDDWASRTLASFERLKAAALHFDALIVSYERFATDEAIVPRLMSALGLAYDPRQNDSHLHVGELTVRGDIGVTDAPAPVSAESVSRREREFDALRPLIARSPHLAPVADLARIAEAARAPGLVRARTFFADV